MTMKVYSVSFRWLLPALLCLAVSACSIPQQPVTLPTDAPTFLPDSATPTIVWFPATATRTVLPMAEATATPQPVPLYGELAVYDAFDEKDAWVTGSYATGNVAFGIKNLSLAVAVPGGSLTSFRRDTYFSDFYYQIHASSSLCQTGDTYGIAFWAVNSQNYYRLALTCAGQYRLERVRENKVSALTDWIGSPQIGRGPIESLQVGLWSGGGLLQIYLNGIYQSEFRTNRATGGIGLFAASNSSSAVTATFRDLEIYDVTPEYYPLTPEPTLRPTKTPLPTIPTPY